MDKKDKNKIKLITALEECRGIVTDACRKVGLSRRTYYDYLKEDEDFKEAVEDVQEIALDFVEGKLFQKINGVTMGKEVDGEVIVYEKEPSDTAIIFYLKTKGKNRGYVERQEITGKDGEDLYSNMTEEDIKKELEQIKEV